MTSLDDYLARAAKTQEHIYYIGGESKETLMKNPLLQGLVKKGYEVLLLDDTIDEYAMQHLAEYEKKKLVNIAKGDFKFPEDEVERRKTKQLKKIYDPLTTWWKRIVSDQIEAVTISQRLVEDPCAVVASEHGYSPNMERISRAQAFASADRMPNTLGMKKILEINPHHPVIKELLNKVNNSEATKEIEELAKSLYEASLISSGKKLILLSIIYEINYNEK